MDEDKQSRDIAKRFAKKEKIMFFFSFNTWESLFT